MKKTKQPIIDEIKQVEKEIIELDEVISRPPDYMPTTHAEELRKTITDYIRQISGAIGKLLKLSGGYLCVKGGRVYFKDEIAPFACDQKDVDKVLGEQIKRIDYCMSYMAGKGVEIRYMAELGKSLNTLYSIYDNADKFNKKLTAAEKARAQMTKKEATALKAEKQAKIAALKTEMGRLDDELANIKSNFNFESPSMPQEFGGRFTMPLGLDKSGENALSWDSGVLYVDASNEKNANISAFLKAIIIRFLYSFPQASAQIMYCCSGLDDESNLFLTALMSRAGKEFFFREGRYYSTAADSYSAASASKIIEQLYKLCADDRTYLLSDSLKKNIAEYNKSNPDNVQAPVLAILRDYPYGYENTRELDYLFKSGERYGLYFVVVKSGEEKPFVDRKGVDCSPYSGLSVALEGGKLICDGEKYTPVSVSDKLLPELLAPLKKIKDMSRGTVSYDDVGFGKEKLEGSAVGNEISIPVGKVGNKIYSLDLAVASNRDSKPVSYMIIGRTGCGKSSIIDSLIINGSMKYSPDDLTFYLIDFKDGVSSAPYIGAARMPHIKLVAQKSRQEEAEIILKTVLKERERRNDRLFKKVGVSNIVDYNKLCEKHGQPHLPRIIVIIDEFQVMFNESSEAGDSGRTQRLAEHCNNIVKLGRSAGIHLIVASQSVTSKIMTSVGNEISGRFCFEVAEPSIAREVFSASRENADAVVRECTGRVGVAMVSPDSGATIQKVRASFHMNKMNEYAAKARERWSGYPINPTVVGDESPMYFENMPGRERLFDNAEAGAPFGVSYYDGQLEYFRFDRTQPTLAIVGDDEGIQTDHLISVTLHALKRGAKVLMIDESISRSLAAAFDGCPQIKQYTKKEYLDMLMEVKAEFERRADDIRAEHVPYFVIINGLDHIPAYKNNSSASKSAPLEVNDVGEDEMFDMSGFSLDAIMNDSSYGGEKMTVSGMDTLLQLLRDASDAGNFYIVFSVSPNAFPSRGYSDDVKLKLFHYKFVEKMQSISSAYRHKSMGADCGMNISLYSEQGQIFEKVRFFRYGDVRNSRKLIKEVLDHEN